jgi:uncharacterized phiE125 gp8 family phage protein
MRPQYQIIRQPEIEPITYAELASHLRVDSSDDEDYVTALISVAREFVDKVTGRVSLESDYLMIADSWASATLGDSGYIRIYRTPLVAVRSVKYYEPGATDITEMPVADYRVVSGTEPGIVHVSSAPGVDIRPDAIHIEFTAGHARVEEISAMHKHAVKLMASVLYENRMPIAPVDMREIPYTLQAIINNIKIGGWTA